MTTVETAEAALLPCTAPGAMKAEARIVTALRSDRHRPQTLLTTVRSEAPLTLRSCIAKGPEPWAAHLPHVARVSLVASAAGPVGGDHHRLDIRVGAGSNLLLNEISATLLLPGRGHTRSRTDVRIQVDAGATMIWMPEPVIAVKGCDHVNDVRIDLAEDARLLVREEVVLGRHREQSGRVCQSIRVRRSERLVYRQDVNLGTPTAATPAVAGAFRTIGSMLLFDPQLDLAHTARVPGEAAMMPLAPEGLLIAGFGNDTLELRHHLSAGLAALGPPWHPEGIAAY